MRPKGGLALFAGLTTAFWILACTGEESGERFLGGTCPTGETCSPLTPQGLVFVGEATYDSQETRLGPIALGGRFDLGVHAPDYTPLPPMAFEIANPGVLQVTEGTGTFNDGNSSIAVDGYLSLRGVAPGASYVRVVDPSTGELFDRIEIEVTEVGEVRLTNAHAAGQPFVPGTENAVGVELYGPDGEEQRAFDLDMQVVSDAAAVGVDPGMWDCFLVDLPATDAPEIAFDVTVGGVRRHATMPVAAP